MKVHAAGEGHLAVDDQKLAMIALIDAPETDVLHGIDGMKPEYLDARLAQALEIIRVGTDAPDVVEDDPHLYPGGAPFQQAETAVETAKRLLDKATGPIEVLDAWDYANSRRVWFSASPESAGETELPRK